MHSDRWLACKRKPSKDKAVRLNATISFQGNDNEVDVYAHDDEAYENNKYFKVQQPHPPDAGLKKYDADMDIIRKC